MTFLQEPRDDWSYKTGGDRAGLGRMYNLRLKRVFISNDMGEWTEIPWEENVVFYPDSPFPYFQHPPILFS